MRLSRFKRFIRNWLADHDSQEPAMSAMTPLNSTRDGLSKNKSIGFRIWLADGGKVVETHNYDDIKDTSRYNVYVIHEDKNLGEELDRIIVMEVLRR